MTCNNLASRTESPPNLQHLDWSRCTVHMHLFRDGWTEGRGLGHKHRQMHRQMGRFTEGQKEIER